MCIAHKNLAVSKFYSILEIICDCLRKIIQICDSFIFLNASNTTNKQLSLTSTNKQKTLNKTYEAR